MQHGSRRGLLIVVLLLGAVLTFALLRAASDPGESPRPAAPTASSRDVDTLGDAPLVREAAPDFEATGHGPGVAGEPARESISGRLLPLRISLELELPEHLAGVPSSPALGSGRTARLTGQLAGARGAPFSGEVHLVAGPDRGRVARTDPAGRFDLTGLYPGLALLEVRASGAVLARREVLLRERDPPHVHVAFGRLSHVAGRVVDSGGEPIAGADVRVDGHGAHSDANGRFQVAGVAPGRVLVEVRADGFAASRRNLDVGADSASRDGELELRLEPEALLRLTASESQDLTRVWILPAGPTAEPRTPWYLFEGLELAGGTLEVRGLPAGPVRVHADRLGARLHGGANPVRLESGATGALTLEFEPAALLTGRVLQDGVALPGAQVELHAADPLLAMQSYLGVDGGFGEVEYLPLWSPVVARTTSDASGTFVLSAATHLSAWRRLVVTGPEQHLRIECAVGPSEFTVEVDLATPVGESASLVVVPSARDADLPYALFVHGRLREKGRLKPGEDLEIDGLVAGQWRVRVLQGARELVRSRSLDLTGETRLPVQLP